MPKLDALFCPKKQQLGKAIMKIDIEGFEVYAFQSAKKLFNTLDFQFIYLSAFCQLLSHS